MSAAKITIGICCYNAAQTIERAFMSALSQDWVDKEIIIVDDQSTDKSFQVLEKLKAKHPEIIISQNPQNMGPAGTRNRIISLANGEFLAFFDDDDESQSQRLNVQYQTLLQTEKAHQTSLVACYASGTRIYPNGHEMHIRAIGSEGDTPPHGPKMAHYLLFFEQEKDWFYGGGTPTCSLMARLSLFKILGSFDDRLLRVEDADFAIRLALKGGYFVGAREKVFVQFSTDAPDKSPERNLASEQQLAIKNQEYLRSINRYYYALHWPCLRYWHFKKRYGRFLVELLALFLRHPLAVSRHFTCTAFKRVIHERKIRA